MPRRSVVPDKTPLHSSALRLKDLTKGRKILLVEALFGTMEKFTVVEAPFVHEYDNGDEYPTYRHLVVNLRDTLGEPRAYFADELGIIRTFDGGWADDQFVIDARKRDLFPDYIVVPAMTRQQIESAFWRAVDDNALDTLEREASLNWY